MKLLQNCSTTFFNLQIIPRTASTSSIFKNVDMQIHINKFKKLSTYIDNIGKFSSVLRKMILFVNCFFKNANNND